MQRHIVPLPGQVLVLTLYHFPLALTRCVMSKYLPGTAVPLTSDLASTLSSSSRRSILRRVRALWLYTSDRPPIAWQIGYSPIVLRKSRIPSHCWSGFIDKLTLNGHYARDEGQKIPSLSLGHGNYLSLSGCLATGLKRTSVFPTRGS